MQQSHSKLILLGLILGGLSWLSAGCEQKSSSSLSSLSNSPRPQPSAPALTPSPTAAIPSAASSQQTAAIPNSTTSGSSPMPPTDAASSPFLNPEDRAIAQKMEKEVQEKVDRLAIQPIGKTYLSGILFNQQAEKLLKGKFSSNLEQLTSDMATDSNDYQLQIVAADADKSIVTATAKTPGLPSYTGAVFAVPEKTPIAGICKTKLPSKTPPEPPTLTGGAIKCDSNSVYEGE